MSYVEPHMKESFKNHELIRVLNSHAFHGWYLKDPKRGRMMSCLILSTPEGLVLQGDLTPQQNGVISAYGYDHFWFGHRLDEGYLCEKFLQKEFVPELAYKRLRAHILDARRGGYGDKEKARNAWNLNEQQAKDYDPWQAHEFYQAFADAGFDYDGEGYGYNLVDAGWLCAIQQRFVELFPALYHAELDTAMTGTGTTQETQE